MLTTVRNRTKNFNNDAMLVDELNSALSYVWLKLYQVYPNLEITFETTSTFASDTQLFALDTAITALGGTFYGHKTFYTLDSNSNQYVPCIFMDVNDPRFLANEQATAQLLIPTYASDVNFGKVRFARRKTIPINGDFNNPN